MKTIWYAWTQLSAEAGSGQGKLERDRWWLILQEEQWALKGKKIFVEGFSEVEQITLSLVRMIAATAFVSPSFSAV